MNTNEEKTLRMNKAAERFYERRFNVSQKRYEIAKEILPVMVNLWYNNNKGFTECYEEKDINPSRQPEDFAASEAVLFADALIRKLIEAERKGIVKKCGQ